MENGAIDLSQEGAELKFKIDPDTGEVPGLCGFVWCCVVLYCGGVLWTVVCWAVVPYGMVLHGIRSVG